MKLLRFKDIYFEVGVMTGERLFGSSGIQFAKVRKRVV